MAVQISSLILTIRATNIPAPAVSPTPVVDIRNPPSRPPSCNGMKKSKLAKRVVKRNNENTVEIVDRRVENEQAEEHLQSRQEPARELQCHDCDESSWILVVQRGYLTVDCCQLLAVIAYES